MRQTEVEIIKSTQQNRVGVQEIFKYLSSNPGGDGGTSGIKEPRKTRKSLDERIVESVSKALVPVINRLDRIENRLTSVEQRLDKVDNRLDKIENRLDRNQIN